MPAAAAADQPVEEDEVEDEDADNDTRLAL